jgi:hypothetical protein
MNGKWEQWLKSSSGRPVPRLGFECRNGASGSLADFSGKALFILFSRSCATCRDVLSKLVPLADEMSVALLILGDQAMEDEEALELKDIIPAGKNVDLASAAFPEIYLGFNIPRGAWLKYPTLFLLDAEGRVRAATDVPEEMTDREWIKSKMSECVAATAARA